METIEQNNPIKKGDRFLVKSKLSKEYTEGYGRTKEGKLLIIDLKIIDQSDKHFKMIIDGKIEWRLKDQIFYEHEKVGKQGYEIIEQVENSESLESIPMDKNEITENLKKNSLRFIQTPFNFHSPLPYSFNFLDKFIIGSKYFIDQNTDYEHFSDKSFFLIDVIDIKSLTINGIYVVHFVKADRKVYGKLRLVTVPVAHQIEIRYLRLILDHYREQQRLFSKIEIKSYERINTTVIDDDGEPLYESADFDYFEDISKIIRSIFKSYSISCNYINLNIPIEY